MDYPKIQTLFLRDEKNIIIPNKFTLTEFEYLKDNKFECTEKIDGTNCHVDIIVEEDNKIGLEFRGRTSKAVIPEHLLSKLKSLFNRDILMDYFFPAGKEPYNIQIFGEGYGLKIQNGGNYIKDGVDFILFDVKVGNWWLSRETCERIARDLNLDIVPLIGYMTIPEAVEYVKKGFKSTIAQNKDYDAEGLVLKTPCGLMARNGQRIITKIKTCDFRKYKAAYGRDNIEQKVNSHYNSQMSKIYEEG